MRRNIRKISRLGLAIFCVFCLCSTHVSVKADEKECSVEELLLHYAEKDRPCSVCSDDSISKIEFLSVDSDNIVEETVLVITTENGGVTQKDYYFEIDTELMRHSSQQTEYKDVDYRYRGKVVIHGSALYVEYYHNLMNYYRPIGVCFSYDKLTNCQVSVINVTYAALGYLFYYPSFQLADYDMRSYSVNAYCASPVTNTVYSASNPYPTNQVLGFVGGGGLSGHSLVFNFSIDGYSGTDSISLG